MYKTERVSIAPLVTCVKIWIGLVHPVWSVRFLVAFDIINHSILWGWVGIEALIGDNSALSSVDSFSKKWRGISLICRVP